MFHILPCHSKFTFNMGSGVAMNILILVIVSGVLTERPKNETIGWKFNYNFQQNDYTIKYDHLDLVRYNKRYFIFFSIHTRRINRTTPAVNFSFSLKLNISTEAHAVIQAYKFMSNEYRYFPVHFGVNLCKAFNANMGGSHDFVKCGNFSGCPIYKGQTYHICNWCPDTNKYPPLVPDGQYMVEVQGMIGTTELFLTRGYGSISRPIAWK